MIGRSIARKLSSKSIAASVRDLTQYVRDCKGAMATPGEKVLFSGAKNFVFDDFALQVDEMISLAKAGCRGKNSSNPIRHYVLSWPESETPTEAQAAEAVEMLLAELRMTTCQTQWALHKDTDNMHVHVVINRVDPETEKILNPGGGFEKETLHRAIAKIENRQGWQPEKNARYQENADGQCVRKERAKVASQEPSEAAKSMELRTGEKSQERVGIELAGPAIAAAKSWAEIYAALEKLGMRYERKDGGAVIWTGAEYVKASAVCKRADSFDKLQKRLGPYELPGEKIDYYSHEIEDIGADGRRPQDGLRKLSECNLAASNRTKGGPGVLPTDARPDRFQSREVRRESTAAGSGSARPAARVQHGPMEWPGRVNHPTGSGARGGAESGSGSVDAVARRAAGGRTGGGSGRREPLNPAFKKWPEYRAARTAHYTLKNAETTALRTAHMRARKELQLLQKQQRTNLFAGSWKGRADALNALRSVVASDQLKTRLKLGDKIKTERLALQKRHRPWPDFETWTRIEDGDEAAIAWRERGKTATGGIFIQPIVKDIRDYTAEAAGRVVVYKDSAGAVAFVDNGKTINVHASDDPAAILAVLQLSVQKWGSVKILGEDEKFRTMCVEVAAKNHIVLSNPDLAARVQKIRDDMGKTGGNSMEVKERPATRVDAQPGAFKDAQSVVDKLKQMKHIEDVQGAKAAQEWRDSWLESLQHVEPKKPSFSIEPYTYTAQKTMLGAVHHHYSDASGARAFTDTGKVIHVHSKSDESLLAAMRLAVEKSGGGVGVKSKDAAFIVQCVKVAAAHGIELADPKLQEQVVAMRAEALRQAVQNKPTGDVNGSAIPVTEHQTAVAGLKDRFKAKPADGDQVHERQR